MVIDFHSHILPGIDDGSKDVPTTMQMLAEASAQGVDLMVATPHFYASRHRVEVFLEKREKAYDKIRDSLSEKFPALKLGAEVAFFRGISRADQIDRLTVEGTRLLLLELSFSPWEDSDLKEVERLIEQGGFTVMLAHLERYMGYSANRDYIRELLEMPLLVQINAESLTGSGFRQMGLRSRLFKMFKNGQAHHLGSDCHGIHHRRPNLGEGREALRKKLGAGFLEEMDRRSEALLGIE